MTDTRDEREGDNYEGRWDENQATCGWRVYCVCDGLAVGCREGAEKEVERG